MSTSTQQQCHGPVKPGDSRGSCSRRRSCYLIAAATQQRLRRRASRVVTRQLKWPSAALKATAAGSWPLQVGALQAEGIIAAGPPSVQRVKPASTEQSSQVPVAHRWWYHTACMVRSSTCEFSSGDKTALHQRLTGLAKGFHSAPVFIEDICVRSP